MTATQATFIEDVPAGYYEVPVGAKVEHCRSCKASVVWTKTSRGAAIPLDTTGHITVEGKRFAKTHFATCPHGRQWRHS